MSSEQEVPFDLEREKLKMERERLELECKKVELERIKIWWTGVSIFIPLCIAAVTISFSAWSMTQQSKLQLEIQTQQVKTQSDIQDKQARSQFELKAAEIAMNSQTPFEAQTKAKAMANIFPDRLPTSFAESFDPATYSMLMASTNPRDKMAIERQRWKTAKAGPVR